MLKVTNKREAVPDRVWTDPWDYDIEMGESYTALHDARFAVRDEEDTLRWVQNDRAVTMVTRCFDKASGAVQRFAT
jgi:hypothetical protein